MLDQLPGLLVHAPDMAAKATVVVNERVFTQGRQELDQLTKKQRTILDREERQGVVKDIWLAAMKKMPRIPVASPAFIRIRQPWLNNWQNHRYLDPLGWGAHMHGLMWFSDDAPAARKG